MIWGNKFLNSFWQIESEPPKKLSKANLQEEDDNRKAKEQNIIEHSNQTKSNRIEKHFKFNLSYNNILTNQNFNIRIDKVPDSSYSQ